MSTNTSNENNTALWLDARDKFNTRLVREVQDDQQIDTNEVARIAGILEAASVVEEMVERARRAPSPSLEVINLLTVLLEKVCSLTESEGGEK